MSARKKVRNTSTTPPVSKDPFEHTKVILKEYDSTITQLNKWKDFLSKRLLSDEKAKEFGITKGNARDLLEKTSAFNKELNNKTRQIKEVLFAQAQVMKKVLEDVMQSKQT